MERTAPPSTLIRLIGMQLLIKSQSWNRSHCKELERLSTSNTRSSREISPDAQLGESIAALKPTVLCNELALQHVIHKGDALSVVNAIKIFQEKQNSVWMIIRDVNMLGKVNHWSIRHVPRSTNNVAHVLAENVLYLYDEIIQLEDICPCMHSLVYEN